jgi:hypothetical protein
LPVVGDGEARVCREVVPLRCAFLGVIGEAKAPMTLGNKLSPPLLHPCSAPLQGRRLGLGDLCRSPGPTHLRLHQVILLLAFFCLDAALFVDDVVGG